MSNSIMLAPLQQVHINNEETIFFFPPNIYMRKMTPDLRRALLDKAKAEECSDELIGAITQSEGCAIVGVPAGGMLSDESQGPAMVNSALYRYIADWSVKSVLRCYRILVSFDVDPELPIHWFITVGKAPEFAVNELKPLYPDLTRESPRPVLKHTPSYSLFTMLPFDEWELRDSERIQRLSEFLHNQAHMLKEPLSFVQKHWDKFSRFTHVEHLNALYCDKAAMDRFWKRAREYLRKKVQEYVDKLDLPPESEDMKIKIPPKLSGGWQITGFTRCYVEELQKRISHPSEERSPLIRAVKLFDEAHDTQDVVFQYVALMTVLESLLSNSATELAYQLGTRLSWVIYPDDPNKRVKLLKHFKKLYNFRSKVVHGSRYSYHQLIRACDKLWEIVVKAIIACIVSEEAWDVLSTTNQKEIDAFLLELSIGARTSCFQGWRKQCLLDLGMPEEFA